MRRPALIVLAVAVSLGPFVSPACAQSAASQTESTSAPNPNRDQQLAATSNEAAKGKTPSGAGEDENAQFRNSGSVQWLAKKLNTSTENAFIISVIINFVLLLVVVYIIFGKKGLMDFFPAIPAGARARREGIRSRLQTAQRESEEAQRRLRDIEAKLSQLGAEINNLNAQAEKQSADEEARLKAAIEEERQRIVTSAQQEIAAAGSSAQRELRTYAAELALDLAAKKIKIDAATDEALLRDFADQLGRNGN
jgi:F-type H+-transporting ATPase subunit b